MNREADEAEEKVGVNEFGCDENKQLDSIQQILVVIVWNEWVEATALAPLKEVQDDRSPLSRSVNS